MCRQGFLTWIARPTNLLAAGCVAVSGPANAQITPGDIVIELEPLISGLVSPIDVVPARDGSDRLFVPDQTGQIYSLREGRPARVFLDVASKLPALNPGFDERGLLGLALHPDFASNGRIFVRYSEPRTGVAGEPCFGTSRGCHNEILAEYGLSAADPNVADLASERILLRISKPQFNHNAGDIEFGPDGFLYVPFGDGGGAHDGLADSPPSHGPFGNGQNIEALLGKILRLDVDSPPAPGLEYAIPADNPFVGGAGRDEIYAYGLRNPYKLAFDDGPGGDGSLYVADVGQARYEEIDLVVKGGNYGWVIREGFHCFDPFNPQAPPATCSSMGALGEPLLDPIAEYVHADGGISITGGFVSRGADPRLDGHYVFGDFSSAFGAPGGRLYYLDQPTPGVHLIREFQIGDIARPYGLYLKGFGEDGDGEIYACGSTVLAPTGASGIVHRLRVICPADVTGDNLVDIQDLAVVLSKFAVGTTRDEGDFDHDGDVDINDLAFALSKYATTCD